MAICLSHPCDVSLRPYRMGHALTDNHVFLAIVTFPTSHNDDSLPPFPPHLWDWPGGDDQVRRLLSQMAADGSWGRYEGPFGERLAEMLSTRFEDALVYLCSSGTIGVELGLRGLGVRSGDEVILAAYDFPGNFRAIEAIGAVPVLADIEPRRWCLDAGSLAAAVSPNTRAVVVSHLHGGLADMSAICGIAKDHGFAVLEDVCQAPGAIVQGRPAGCWGDAAALSFGGSKLLTAGRGGAVLTKRRDVLQRIKVFAERGNLAFPLSELQAAVVTAQLEKLDGQNEARRDNAARLLAEVASCCGLLEGPKPPHDEDSPAFYKVPWLWCDTQTRDLFSAACRDEGIILDAGFRGFTRRSPRRCRRPVPLTASEHAALCTVVLHHPILLQPAAVISQLATRIVAVAQAWTPPA